MQEFYIASNGGGQLRCGLWTPEGEAKAVVQIIHGIAEHIGRYDDFASFLAARGYVVAADDHMGHGGSVTDGLYGYFRGGWMSAVADEKTLHDKMAADYPGLPYYILGHSMGSFIARDYITKYGDELAGVTLCGTSGVFPHVEEGIELLKKEVAAGHGEDPATEAPNVVMGWMFGRCDEEIKLGNEWICSDPCVQYDHAHDPFDAFTKPTTNRSFLYFCQMITAITGADWAKNVPTELPIFNIAGDQDPVGQYGEGVYQVSNWLTESGHAVETKLYPGYRHEIHNYEDLKDEVVEDIICFFDEQLDFDDDDDDEE